MEKIVSKKDIIIPKGTVFKRSRNGLYESMRTIKSKAIHIGVYTFDNKIELDMKDWFEELNSLSKIG